MSTRSSILCVPGLHLYWEGNADEICVETYEVDEPEGRKLNFAYNSVVLTDDELVHAEREISWYLRNKALKAAESPER